jgi:UDP-GlcNAc:undecaprenyl-phosphate GlcNAc-1-phosphate transferase
MVDLGAYVIVGIVATAVTALTTPVVRAVARQRHWLAMPNERTVHSVPTPNIGGVAMYIGVIVSLVVAWQMDQFSFVFNDNSEPLGVFIAATLILVVGTWDDLKNLSAPARVVGIIATALVMVYFGITMFYFFLLTLFLSYIFYYSHKIVVFAINLLLFFNSLNLSNIFSLCSAGTLIG